MANRGRRGHGPGGAPAEKAKDFKGAIKRLLHELRSFRVLISLALILAALGSILTIFTPNILSDLTDKISEGLVVNKEALTSLTEQITSKVSEEALEKKLPTLLAMDLSEKNVQSILVSDTFTKEEKQALREFSRELLENPQEMMSLFIMLPLNIQKALLPESTYESITISTVEKIDFLKGLNEQKMVISNSIAEVLFDEFSMDQTVISKIDQAHFLEVMSDLDENATVQDIYQRIDEAPESIQKIVKPFMDIEKIKSIALVVAIILILSAIFTYVESISMTIVSNGFAKGLRSRISKKINKLPLSYFDRNQTGDILSRVTNDIDTVAQSMNQSLSTLVSALTLFLGTILMMFITNWIMAITAIVSSLIGFVFMFLVLSKSQKYFTEKQEELGLLNGHIEEVYSGLNVIKAYNGKKIADEKFNALNEKMYHANWKSQFLSGLMMPMMNFIGNFGYVAVCIVGALLTMNGKISFGVIIAFISYVRLFTSPLSQMAQAMTSLQSTAAASERVFEILDEREMREEKSNVYLEKEKVKGNIEFDHVVFKYEGNEEPTIRNFSAKASSGQKIAIVGPTGAGKTTMVNLLMRFYDIDSGIIKIDGVDTNRLSRENIHKLFTMVLQDTWLFNGTIKENIIYNRENVSDERIKEVCKTVGLDHFIKTLPKGYDSLIGDNDSVSAGQRQLLTIARGMIEDAPFLILDEATSNVDTRTEELVQKAMDKLMKGRTSFIIAHRLSTIKNADLILVMKDGNIIETGNHDELIAQNGFYAELYNSQFDL